MLKMMIAQQSPELPPDRLLAAIARASAGGVDYIQVREKAMDARALARWVREVMAAAGGAKVLVNTRVDVALACGAAGAHLPGGAPPPALWTRIAPPDFVFSVACHSVPEAAAAEREGASLIVFAPVFDPRSKPASGAPAGLARLSEVCQAVRIPVLALGGITAERIGPCLGAGAAGFAAISYFLE
jgi:thiamine-phosphate pyrophosphorylase